MTARNFTRFNALGALGKKIVRKAGSALDLAEAFDDRAFKGVDLQLNATQEIALDGTEEELVWAAGGYDVGSWFTSGTDVTVPVGVDYVSVHCNLIWEAVATTGEKTLDIMVNGTSVYNITDTLDAAAAAKSMLAATVLAVSPGDVISIEVATNAAGAVDVTKGIGTNLQVVALY